MNQRVRRGKSWVSLREVHKSLQTLDLLEEIVVEVELLNSGQPRHEGDLLYVVLAKAQQLEVAELGHINWHPRELLLNERHLLQNKGVGMESAPRGGDVSARKKEKKDNVEHRPAHQRESPQDCNSLRAGGIQKTERDRGGGRQVRMSRA